jgi:hypothetical protein
LTTIQTVLVCISTTSQPSNSNKAISIRTVWKSRIDLPHPFVCSLMRWTVLGTKEGITLEQDVLGPLY